MIFLQIISNIQEGSATNKPGIYTATDEWEIFLCSEERNIKHCFKAYLDSLNVCGKRQDPLK